MKLLHRALVGAVVLIVPALAYGKDVEKGKLVGVWEIAKSDLPQGSTIEFTKAGKLLITVRAGDQTVNMEGTYRVDGDTLTTVLKQGDKEVTEKMKIQTLTDKQLVTIDQQGKADEFKKK